MHVNIVGTLQKQQARAVIGADIDYRDSMGKLLTGVPAQVFSAILQSQQPTAANLDGAPHSDSGNFLQIMSTIELGCRLEYQVEFETSFIFQIAALNSSRQKILQEKLTCNRSVSLETSRAGFLEHRLYRAVVQPCIFELNYTATIENNPLFVESQSLMAGTHASLPAEVLEFLNPSRYCESDRLERLAWDTFGNTPEGHPRVQAVAEWVFNNLSYLPGSTGPSTTAVDVILQRTGVCRDFAHVMISLCRALGIPARYVAGYAVDLVPPDFHGFVEVYLDGGWYLFDSTRLAPVDGFVRIGAGRDAADLSFATYVGNSLMNRMDVWASMVAAENSAECNSLQRSDTREIAISVD